MAGYFVNTCEAMGPILGTTEKVIKENTKALCSVLIHVAMIKHLTKSNMGEERIYL